MIFNIGLAEKLLGFCELDLSRLLLPNLYSMLAAASRKTGCYAVITVLRRVSFL